MNQHYIYCIHVLSNLSSKLLRDIRIIIISLMKMLDDSKPRIYCGSNCTIVIKYDLIKILGNACPNDLILLPGRKIDSINFCHRDIIYLSKCDDRSYVVERIHDTKFFGWFIESYMQPEFKIPDVISLHCGINHKIVLTKNSECYGWGSNYHGQLGFKDELDRASPVKIPISNVRSVSCGYLYTIFLTETECFVCGQNDHGQLGLGHSANQCFLQKLNLPDIILIECGKSHTFALTKNGIYSWGQTFWGQLGLGKRHHYVDRAYLTTPHKVDFKHYSHVVSIKCGPDYTMMLTKSGNLFGCGSNHFGQLGFSNVDNNSILHYRSTFHKINFNKNEFITSVHCGRKHIIATTKHGEFYGWGFNKHGELGMTNRGVQLPTLIKI